MFKKKSKLDLSKEKAQMAVDETNEKIKVLGSHDSDLNNALIEIQELFDCIRHIPSHKKIIYEKAKKTRLEWKQQVEKIESDFKKGTIKNAGAGGAGASLGVAVVSLGPTVAMGVATTVGVASTGTAISTLSGAAATNAALAWLGGGTLAAGGGGMAAGEMFLGLAGPVGWSIAAVSLLAGLGFIVKDKKDKEKLDSMFLAISERDIKSLNLAMVELDERIARIDRESKQINEAIKNISTFGIDYKKMAIRQKIALGSYVNLMNSSAQLLVNPIAGLQPKFTSEDFDGYMKWKNRKVSLDYSEDNKNMIVYFANILYKIDLSEEDKKLLWKCYSKNKKLLASYGMKKKDFSIEMMDAVTEALEYKYENPHLHSGPI